VQQSKRNRQAGKGREVRFAIKKPENFDSICFVTGPGCNTHSRAMIKSGDYKP
jgi:hypothetical protein